ncbi:hypothetical protein ABZ646_39720 [Streptomyces sp. NPDC007162]|uniref:hypothetical protein n=1 Tax=Streptomyces sp. NPDC007162 TaxID=3156917 RepID=UPI00340AB62A
MTLDETARKVLERLAVSAKAQVRQVLRARIVLAATDGWPTPRSPVSWASR